MSRDQPPEQQFPRVLLVGGRPDTQRSFLVWAEAVGGSVLLCQDVNEALGRRLHEYDAVVVGAAVTWNDLSASLESFRTVTNGAPLLVITDAAAAESTSAELTAGGEDFVVRPYDTEELIGRLKRLLAQAADSDSLLCFEDVEIDVRDRVCRVNGELVRLTPKELGILEALLREAPCTVSRNDLLKEVWAGDVERGRRALDVHMAHLRQKLTSAYSRASVATVRGTGFRVAEVRVQLPAHLVLEAAPDGMLVVDAEGHILMVNAMLENLFGYERSELIGVAVEALIPDRFGGEHHWHREQFEESASTRRMDSGLALFGKHRDGSEFPVDVSLSPIKTCQGHYVVAAVRVKSG